MRFDDRTAKGFHRARADAPASFSRSKETRVPPSPSPQSILVILLASAELWAAEDLLSTNRENKESIASRYPVPAPATIPSRIVFSRPGNASRFHGTSSASFPVLVFVIQRGEYFNDRELRKRGSHVATSRRSGKVLFMKRSRREVLESGWIEMFLEPSDPWNRSLFEKVPAVSSLKLFNWRKIKRRGSSQ